MGLIRFAGMTLPGNGWPVYCPVPAGTRVSGS